jgi:hypothetical protein
VNHVFDQAMSIAAAKADAIPAGRVGPNGWEDTTGIAEWRDMEFAKAFNALPRAVRDEAARAGEEVPGCIVYAAHDPECRYNDGAWAMRCSVGCPDCM